MASARPGVPAAKSGLDRNTLTLVWPSAARAAISASVPSPRPASTGCRNQSAAASALAPAMSRAIAAVINSPGREAPGEGRQRAGPEIVHPRGFLRAHRLRQRGADQVHVSVDAPGDDQQAVGAEFALAGHRAADLGYPAILHPEVGDLPMARSNDGPAADDEIETRNHRSFLIRPVRRG